MRRAHNVQQCIPKIIVSGTHTHFFWHNTHTHHTHFFWHIHTHTLFSGTTTHPSLAHSHTHTFLAHTHTLFLAHTHTLFLVHTPHTLFLAHTHRHRHTHTHTTDTQTHRHTDTHTHTYCIDFGCLRGLYHAFLSPFFQSKPLLLECAVFELNMLQLFLTHIRVAVRSSPGRRRMSNDWDSRKREAQWPEPHQMATKESNREIEG